jgi:hypothetical protein
MLPVLLTSLVLMSTDWACAQTSDSISQPPSSDSQRHCATSGGLTQWAPSVRERCSSRFFRRRIGWRPRRIAIRANGGKGRRASPEITAPSWQARWPSKLRGVAQAHCFTRIFDIIGRRLGSRCFALGTLWPMDSSIGSGHSQIALANFIGAGAAGYAARLYLPDGFNDVSHADTRIAIRFGLLEVNHVLTEFAPEFERLGEKMHLKHRRINRRSS